MKNKYKNIKNGKNDSIAERKYHDYTLKPLEGTGKIKDLRRLDKNKKGDYMNIQTYTNYQGKRLYVHLDKPFQVGTVNDIIMVLDGFYHLCIYSTDGWNIYDYKHFDNKRDAINYFKKLVNEFK